VLPTKPLAIIIALYAGANKRGSMLKNNATTAIAATIFIFSEPSTPLKPRQRIRAEKTVSNNKNMRMFLAE
jgi:hypothetical protein